MSLRTLACSAFVLAVASGPASAQVEDIRTQFKRGTDLVQAGKLDEAEAVFHALSEKTPGIAEVHYNLGYIAQQRGDLDAAAAAYAKALELKPNNNQAGLALAWVRREKRRKDLERSLAATPVATAGAKEAFTKAVELADARRWEEAETAFQALTVAQPKRPEGWFNLGKVLVRRKKPQEAVAAFTKAVELRPADSEAVLALARLHADAGDKAKAVEVLTRAATASPTVGDVQLELGLLKRDAGQDAEASTALLKALELNPQLSEAHYHLGVLAVARSDKAEGIRRFEQYLAGSPENPVNATAASRLIEALKKTK